MIGARDLLTATFDSIAVTSEGVEGTGALSSAGLDPLETVRVAKTVTEGYPDYVAELQQQGMTYRDALLATLAVCWTEGCIAGARAARGQDDE